MTEEREAEQREVTTYGTEFIISEAERERQAAYKQLEELGEAEVDRLLHEGRWLNDETSPLMATWASSWLRGQKTNRESRAVVAAEATADAVKSSARSAKVAARWAIWASVIALLAIVWNVWGS